MSRVINDDSRFFFSKTNRLEESKNIFDTIVNNTAFQSISIILFLNKSDLLAQKVKNPETDIRWYYPQYTGNPHSIIDVQTFILQMFLRVRRNNSHHQSLKPPQPIYHHFTTAVDTQNIQVVFNSVKDTILNRNLASLMLQWNRQVAEAARTPSIVVVSSNLSCIRLFTVIYLIFILASTLFPTFFVFFVV